MPPPVEKPESRKAVRSFVRRAGRLTTGQRKALSELWPIYGVEFSPAPLELDTLFGRRAPRVMEIGFGNGKLLVTMAAEAPGADFLGVEVHEPGVGHCLMGVAEQQITNVRVIMHDAVEVLREQIPDASLDAVHLFFPDPWPKKRHHKRRLVQPDFVDLLRRKIKAGGIFRVATDWANYADHIEATMAASPEFELAGDSPDDRGTTKFEQRGKNLGHAIRELVYRRVISTQDR